MAVKLREILETIPVYRPGESPDECGLENAVKLSSNESPWEPPASVVAAVQEAALELNRYPDYYKEQLCIDLASCYGLDPAWVSVDNGSGSLLQDVVRIVCDDGDEVLYSTPTFAAYEIDVKLAGAKPVTCPLDDSYRYDPATMLGAITDKTRLVLFCNPNNPTGTYLAVDELEAFIAAASKDVLIVIDEAYHDFERVEPLEASLELVKKHDNVALLRTYSKALGLAGMRIGYCIAQPYIIDATNKTVAEFSVSTPAQAAARACLEASALQLIEQRVACIVENRECFEAGLARAGIDYVPSSSNFIMLPCENYMERFYKLKEAGVITRPFADPKGVRITIGTAEQMQRVAAALGFSLEEQ